MLGLVILGMIIWQAVVVVAILVTDENEDIFVPVSMGVWCVVLLAIGKVNHAVKMFKSRKYNIYQFYGEPTSPDDKPLKYWVCNLCMTTETAKLFRQEGEYDSYYVKMLRAGKEFKQPVYKSEIITPDDMSRLGSPEFVKKFLVNGG